MQHEETQNEHDHEDGSALRSTLLMSIATFPGQLSVGIASTPGGGDDNPERADLQELYT
jgi:hypothetical protein